MDRLLKTNSKDPLSPIFPVTATNGKNTLISESQSILDDGRLEEKCLTLNDVATALVLEPLAVADTPSAQDKVLSRIWHPAEDEMFLALALEGSRRLADSCSTTVATDAVTVAPR